jgi:cbb3-type cytochrome oxidase maturation protein
MSRQASRGYFWNLKFQPLSALIILISASILVALGFLVAFLWSTKSGQFDDDYTPSVRMLFEDAPKPMDPVTKETSKT